MKGTASRGLSTESKDKPTVPGHLVPSVHAVWCPSCLGTALAGTDCVACSSSDRSLGATSILILNAGSALGPTVRGRTQDDSAHGRVDEVLADPCHEELLAELELFNLEKGEDRPNSLPITALSLAPVTPILGVSGFGGPWEQSPTRGRGLPCRQGGAVPDPAAYSATLSPSDRWQGHVFLQCSE